MIENGLGGYLFLALFATLSLIFVIYIIKKLENEN